MKENLSQTGLKNFKKWDRDQLIVSQSNKTNIYFRHIMLNDISCFFWFGKTCKRQKKHWKPKCWLSLTMKSLYTLSLPPPQGFSCLRQFVGEIPGIFSIFLSLYSILSDSSKALTAQPTLQANHPKITFGTASSKKGWKWDT